MEDLIRRSDAISRKGVSAWLDNMGYPRLANAVMDKKRFPSADRPQGEWIETDETDCGATVYKCSVCGDDVAEMPTVMGVPKYKFCPYCGAMMKGADDEDN